MKTIKIKIKDNVDLALLLSGINTMRRNNLGTSISYFEVWNKLPKKFKMDKIISELADDYDRLNTLAAQLSLELEK